MAELAERGKGLEKHPQNKGKRAKNNQILAEMSPAHSRPGICCDFLYCQPMEALRRGQTVSMQAVFEEKYS